MKYKKGDILMVIARKNGHQFKIGAKVKIKEVTDIDYFATNLSGRSGWWIQDDELKKIE